MRRIILSVVVSCGCETKSLILRKERISSILNWFTITMYLNCNYSNIMGVSGTRILLRRVSVLQDHRWGLYIDLSFWRVRKIVKSGYWLRNVRPHGTTELPLNGLSWNLIFEYFSKICHKNSSFIKIWEEYRVLYMKTNVYLWSYLSVLLRMRNFSDKRCREKSKHILCSITFFKRVPLMR